MEYLILGAIGLAMGVFGGLLGIGGSVIMIPALVFAFGENQHLYQASAMICNFFVGAAAVIVHKNANSLVGDVIKWLIPSAIFGIVVGVAVSNSLAFARQNSYLLARLYGVFLVFVVIYNILRLGHRVRGGGAFDVSQIRRSAGLTIISGLLSGISAGLLGLGGGVVCIPTQQLFLRMPLKMAISNSAAMIASIALIGAFYKNVTLPQHNIQIAESVRMAAIVMPGAILGSFFGSRFMHKFPISVVRAVFIAIAFFASYKMLTVAPGA